MSRGWVAMDRGAGRACAGTSPSVGAVVDPSPTHTRRNSVIQTSHLPARRSILGTLKTSNDPKPVFTTPQIHTMATTISHDLAWEVTSECTWENQEEFAGWGLIT
ncbi:hypothetical protein IAQ61_011848 [Plenodomus lingam]|uniref:uncharacterized protein n=1 Tax=Leptosphaeria maculans TaxID=5022 RepID=UPI00331700B6|nr:hypothetical protein IAQ61_011848 [Plenodomus lingam]